MGISESAVGVRSQPVYNASPATVPDFQAAVDYAAKVGNRMAGTTAERNAFESSGWEGLEWDDTTLDRRFRHNGTTFAGTATIGSVAAAPSSGITVNGPTFVRKDDQGMVEAYIDLTRSSALPSGAPIAIIAGGFRPSTTLRYSGTVSEGGTAGTAYVQIESSGNVTVFNPGAGNQRVTVFAKYPGA